MATRCALAKRKEEEEEEDKKFKLESDNSLDLVSRKQISSDVSDLSEAEEEMFSNGAS